MEDIKFADDLPSTSTDNIINSKMPCILNGKYFQIIKRRIATEHQKSAGGIVARCLHCVDEMKVVHGSIRVTSNFIRHLQVRHPQVYEGYLQEKKSYGMRRGRISELQTSIAAAKAMKEPFKRATETVSFEMHPENCTGGMLGRSFGNRNCSTDLYDTEESHIARDDPLEAMHHGVEVTNYDSSIVKTELFSTEYYHDSAANYQRSANHSDCGTESPPTFFKKINASFNNADTQAETEAELPVNLPIIINGKYFRVLRISKLDNDGHGIIAICQFCRVEKLVRGSVRVTSNFLRHLKFHPYEYQQYLKERKATKLKRNRKQTHKQLQLAKQCKTVEIKEQRSFLTDDTDNESLLEDEGNTQDQSHNENVINSGSDSQDSDSGVPKIPNETYFQIAEVAKMRPTSSKQTPKFVERVLKFIVENYLPFDIAESASFKGLFDGIGVRICTATALQMQLECKYQRYIEELKILIRNVEYVCTTEDVWSYEGAQYLGYTCHWIDADLKRQSKVLAVTMLDTPPTSESLDALIQQINKSYDLHEKKILCTLVCNVNDFVRSYHEFNMMSFCCDPFAYTHCVLNSNAAAKLEICRSSFEISQVKCSRKQAAQTLHLLALVDYNDALQDYDVLKHALERCIEIIYKCSESAPAVEAALDIKLTPPVDVRWTSLYAALTLFLMYKDKLTKLCAYLNVEAVEATEIAHVEEFCMLLKSLVEALDFLEEHEFYYGYFLPTLITIKVKLKMLHESGKLTHLKEAVEKIIGGLVARFRSFFELSKDCDEAVVAAIACPSIKLRFVDALKETAPHISSASLESLFVQYASELYGKSDDAAAAKETLPTEDSFLCFNSNDNEEQSTESESASYVIRSELYRYLNDKSRNLDCLQKYPILLKVFRKYNTRIACTAPVERLLQTFLDISNNSNRHKMSCKEVERLMLVKANNII